MLLTAPISNISRASLHDGPGIRSVVYFMGCSMRCLWCHNPENLSAKCKILYAPVKCVHCGHCIDVCPEHHKIVGNEHIYLRDGCITCGRCVDVCHANALTLCGGDMSIDEVTRIVFKDKAYYELSGGGVTLSGGECLRYPDFVHELLTVVRNEHIHTVIETALYVPWTSILSILDVTDLVYADLKIVDAEKHKKYTGVDNKLIISNLINLTKQHQNVIIRIPLIPGVNDSLTDMMQFADILGTMGIGLKAIELLKYNHLASSKYSMAGMEYTSFGNEPQTDEKVEELRCALRSALENSSTRSIEII